MGLTSETIKSVKRHLQSSVCGPLHILRRVSISPRYVLLINSRHEFLPLSRLVYMRSMAPIDDGYWLAS